MLKRGMAALLLLSLFVSSAACSSKKTDSENAVTTSQSTIEQTTVVPEQTKLEETAKPDNTVKNDFILPVEGTRPFAVMIDNEGSRVLPQGGIYLAQVVYEIVVEGGVTRLMPVFWNVDPEMIGPVRSSRHYFIDYAMEHDAIYVHFGYSPKALHDLKALKINNVNGVANGGEVFWDLTKDKRNWQDSYTSMEKVKGYIKKVKYRTETDKKQVFTYNQNDVEPTSGQKAEKIRIAYSSSYSSGYEYDASTKNYMRFRKDKLHMERITGKQLTAKNIIIQVTRNQRITGDDKDRQELYNIGNGSGWYITDGKAIKIKWSKASRSAPTKYTDEAGSPVTLNPGQTWIQIVPSSGKIAIE